MRKIFILFFLIMGFAHTSQAMNTPQHHTFHKVADYVKQSKDMQGISEQIVLLRYEIESLGDEINEANHYRLNKWIRKLEARVETKMQEAKTSLEKYQTQTHEIHASKEDVEQRIEKIHFNENKIQACQELLKLLDQLKVKLNGAKNNN